MRLHALHTAALLLMGALAGCSSVPRLTMDANRPPRDKTIVSPSLAAGTYKRVVVNPPVETVEGEFKGLMDLIQKEFKKHGVEIVDVRVHSRDADAILHIYRWGWSEGMQPERFFILRSGEDNYTEVSAMEYQSHNGYKLSFPANELRFVGRLINPETGETMASFDVRSPANFNLPGRYNATVKVEGEAPTILTESFPYSKGEWMGDSRTETEKSVIQAVCDRILKKREVSPVTLMPNGDSSAE